MDKAFSTTIQYTLTTTESGGSLRKSQTSLANHDAEIEEGNDATEIHFRSLEVLLCQYQNSSRQ